MSQPRQPDLAFTELYRARYDGLVRLAAVILDDDEVAEEVVQDAFARLHLRWDHVEDPPSYVRRSVVNACRDVLRRRRVERAFLRRTRPVERPAEPDYLGDALAELPARERIALVLRHYEGLSEKQIAEALGCPQGTVKTLLHRGTERLRKRLEP
ncbi:MAG TPA: SigE family RNA polymerase sigma factor [Acidimicrobiales bacterium]|nr:SigE family RNA polymerase sigma factor [Acidimicrobiales bacterium]